MSEWEWEYEYEKDMRSYKRIGDIWMGTWEGYEKNEWVCVDVRVNMRPYKRMNESVNERICINISINVSIWKG